MWPHGDRPFKGVDKIAAATEFISAAERLIARDVRPEVLPSQTRASISRVLRSALHIDDQAERTRI